MRENVKALVRLASETLSLRGPVYEFGSYLVEDQLGRGDLRPFFPGREFVGCDMRPGPGVDRIEDLSQLSLDDQSVQTIICVDTLEHVFEVRRAVDEMLRVLAPGGVIVVSVPFDFRVHDYPSDYWRLTPSCLSRLFAPLGATLVGWQGLENDPHTVFAIGCQGPVPDRFITGLSRFIDGFQSYLAQLERARPWTNKLKQWTIGQLRGRGERRRQRAHHEAGFAMQMPLDGSWKKLWAAGLERVSD